MKIDRTVKPRSSFLSAEKDMGIISTDLSDYVIFTNDNPRSEDMNQIINDIIHELM